MKTQLLCCLWLLHASLPVAHAQQTQPSPSVPTTSANVGVQRFERWKQDLVSGDRNRSSRAKGVFIDSYESKKATQQDRDAITAIIVTILTTPVDGKENWTDAETPRNLACQIAGRVKIVAAVPALIKLLKIQPNQYVGYDNTSLFPIETKVGKYNIGFPADALKDIGKAAEPALKIERARNPDPEVQANLHYILDGDPKEGEYE